MFHRPSAQAQAESQDESAFEADLNEFGAARSPEGWYYRLSGRASFAAGRPAPTGAAAAKLAQLATILRRHPDLALRLEGHIDHSEAMSVRADISRLRAISVGRILADHGVSPKKIRVIGFGDGRPMAGRDAAINSTQNRRVDIRIIRNPKTPRTRSPGGSAVVADSGRSKARSGGWWDDARRAGLLNFDGYVKEESAYQVPRPQGLSKLRSTGFFAVSGRLTDFLSYKASGRAFYDGVFALTRRYPPAVAQDLRAQAELRDTYADLSLGDWDLRLGKQQVVWGEAVSVFIADAVNAKDYREYVLPGFDFMRRPHWGATLEYTHSDFHAEVTGTPYPLFNQLARPGYEFAAAPNLPPGVQVRVDPVRDPPRTLGNGEIGGRLSYLMDGWDLAAFHLYAWDKFPVDQSVIKPNGTIVVTPVRRRLPLTGATFSKEQFGVVWKGEALYSAGKRLSSLNPNDRDGIARRDTLDYLLGLDYDIRKKVDLNLQLVQRRVFAYGPTELLSERPEQTSLAAWLKTGFFDNHLEPEILVISDAKRLDMMIVPKLTATIGGNCQATVGYDFFQGKPNGLFGQYDRHDRVFAEAKYTF